MIFIVPRQFGTPPNLTERGYSGQNGGGKSSEEKTGSKAQDSVKNP
jgi:hypothetical protein